MSVSAIRADPGSFRDPDGRLYPGETEMYRALTPQAMARLRAFLEGPAAAAAAPWLVPTEVRPAPAGFPLSGDVLTHRRIVPLTYCYEWCPEQLRDAALLTLRLHDTLLGHGYCLKDASPFNVVFDGVRPLFVDIPSIRAASPENPFPGMLQLLEGFVLPLMARAYLGWDLRLLTGSSLGRLSLDEGARLFRGVSRFRRGTWSYLWLPRLAARFSAAEEGPRTGMTVPVEIERGNCRRLIRFLESLPLRRKDGAWTGYDASAYCDADRAAKLAFVETAVRERRPVSALDVGTNRGDVALAMAAAGVSQVAALDSDPGCIDAVYLAAKERRANVSPWLMDFACPTPSLGWEGKERSSFDDRIGKRDLVTALALIHHLRFTAGIPLDAAVRRLASLGRDVIVEWVPPSDPMARRIGSDRIEAADYRREVLEQTLGQTHAIRRKLDLGNGRRLYEAHR